MQERVDVRRFLTLALLGALLAVAACGDEGEDAGAQSARLSDAEPLPVGEPLTMTSDIAGLPLGLPTRCINGACAGDMTLIQNSSSFELVTTRFKTAVVTVPVLDERETLFSNPDSVRDNPAPFQARKRLDDLFDEVDEVLAAKGAEQWDNYVLVFDLFRVSGNWLVRWDGVKINEIDEPGQYGLWRSDMRQEVSDLIFAALDAVTQDRNITHVVIGDEMERLLLSTRNFPNNPEEFANFVTFYRELRGQIKADFPDIQVSAGINWDRLVTEVAARYTAGGSIEEVKFAEIRRAWQEVAEPLYEEADFLALSSEPDPSLYGGDPDGLPESQYALLAEVQGARPVIWTAINWPINSTAEKSTQGDYLERFLALNAGNDVELISWKIMVDLPEQGDCALVKGLQGRVQDCFAGFFSNSLAPTDVSDLFIPAE